MFEFLHGIFPSFQTQTPANSMATQSIHGARVVSVGNGEDRQSLTTGAHYIFHAISGAFQSLCPKRSPEDASQTIDQPQQLAHPAAIDQLSINAACGRAGRGDAQFIKQWAQALTPKQLSHAQAAGANPLMFAAANGHTGCVSVLVDRLQTPEHINHRGRTGMTALMFAAQNGHIDCVKALADLLQTPEAINTARHDGTTTLMLAAAHGRIDCVKELSERLGPSASEAINSVRKDGMNSLMLAAESGHIDCVRFFAELLQTREAINTPRHDGKTAMMLAAANGHDDCLAALAEYSIPT